MLLTDIKYSRKKLKNGLELVVAPMPESPTITILVLFKVGSRYELANISGISHFVEHIVFKGNKLYKNPKDISSAIDEVGGVFNAFTSKEYTGFHVKVGAKFAPLAIKWLGALVSSPLIPKKDVDAERNVILEEINMYNDTPARQVDDIFEDLLFSGSSLGRSIIGTKNTLFKVGKNELQNYFKSHYYAENAVLAVAGNLSGVKKNQLEKEIQKYFNLRSSKENNSFSLVKNNQKKIVKAKYKKTDQTHLMLGAKTFSLFDKRRYQLALISTIMGSGMSSWAFTEIREKRGLAYYVHSLMQLHQDVGYFSINAGLNNQKIYLAIEEITKLFKKMRDKFVSPSELKKAKDQMIGSMYLERETSSDSAFILGSEIAARGEVTPFSKEIKVIRSIGREDLRKLAREFFNPEQLRLACIGPWKEKDEEKFAKLLK